MSVAIAADPHDAAWHEERRTYIGASDVAVIFGVSPWQTEYSLWLEKRGELVREEQTQVQSWGHRVEQVAADIYTEVTGRRLRRYDERKVHRHKRFPMIACHPDRGVIGERRGVELKSSWKPMPVAPDNYQLQAQTTMAVMGWEVMDLAVLTGFGGFQPPLEIPRDDEQIRLIEDVVPAWWQRHIVEGIEPERTGRYLNGLRGEDTMRASDAQVDALRALRDIRERATRLDAQDDNIVEWLKRSMSGARRLDGRDYGVSATWTKAWSKDVEETDWRAVAAAYRLLCLAQGEEGIEIPEAVRELTRGGRLLDAPTLDAIESIHTNTVTKSGGGGLTVKWKDVEPTSEEEQT